MESIKEVLGRCQPSTVTRPSIETHSRYSPDPLCPICRGGGFVCATDANGNPVYSVVRSCSCLRKSAQQYMRTDAFRTERGANPAQTFENFKRATAPECYDRAKAWSSADATFQWFLVYGGVGNGKSHLCSAALNQLLDRGLNGSLRIAALFLSMLRAGIADHSIDDMMAGYQALPYLILDDLGAGMKKPSEPSGEWEWMQIEQLLVARYDPPKPTMVVTNLDWRELPPRIASRFQDTVVSRIVRNDAGDYRGKR